MILSFKDQFAGAVERREKKHTIRATKHPERFRRRFAVGTALQLYTGPYRPGERRNMFDVDPVVTKLERIQIMQDDNGMFSIIIEGELSFEPGAIPFPKNVATHLSIAETDALAKADGFLDRGAFYDFFVPNRGDVFRGHVIHWDWK